MTTPPLVGSLPPASSHATRSDHDLGISTHGHNGAVKGVDRFERDGEDVAVRFFDELWTSRQRIVPVVGSGLAIEVGAPGVTALRQELLAAAGSEWAVRRLADDDQAATGQRVPSGDLYKVAGAPEEDLAPTG